MAFMVSVSRPLMMASMESMASITMYAVPASADAWVKSFSDVMCLPAVDDIVLIMQR